jgi:diguanylate cyclase (GGDEF)-like protein
MTFMVGCLIGFARSAEWHIRDKHKEANFLVQHDFLTGLLSRASISAQLTTYLESSQSLAILLIDLDGFKFVNDNHGHHVGDELLVAVAKRIREALRSDDLIARLGGDEFVIGLPKIQNIDQASNTAQKLVEMLAKPYFIHGCDIQVSASIGISLAPRDGVTVSDLLKHADSAMYEVKRNGKQAFHVFTKELQKYRSTQIVLEKQLRQDLDGNRDSQLELHYQPVIDLATGRLEGFEALLRWHHPELGPISPTRLINVAENSGLIMLTGEWVIQQVCKQLKQWQDSGLTLHRIAVNVSPTQLGQPRFADMIASMLEMYSIEARYLEVEITENSLMRHYDQAVLTLKKLQALGIRIAIDDFGTGYSSLAYLRHLPVHTLKIDRSFVTPLEKEPFIKEDVTIVESIASLAHHLGKTVTVEGIESSAQLRFLQGLGCDLGQGYYFAKPLTSSKAEQLLMDNSNIEEILSLNDIEASLAVK